MKLKHLLFALLFSAAACEGDAGVMGPTGPAGPAGAPGKDAEVDYGRVMDTVRAQLSPLVAEEVRTQLPPLVTAEVRTQLPMQVAEEVTRQVVNPPPVNVDSVVAAVIAALPPNPTIDEDALVARVIAALPPVTPPEVDIADITRRVQAELAKTPNVIEGDLWVKGCVSIGEEACRTDIEEKLQLRQPGSAALYLESNRNGLQYQSPLRHFATMGLSNDGGLRLINNAVWVNNVRVTDGVRPYGIVGYDSQSDWSWLTERPGYPHEYTQDLTLRFYENQKKIAFESWRPGWSFAFGTSTGLITLDMWYDLPKSP